MLRTTHNSKAHCMASHLLGVHATRYHGGGKTSLNRDHGLGRPVGVLVSCRVAHDPDANGIDRSARRELPLSGHFSRPRRNSSGPEGAPELRDLMLRAIRDALVIATRAPLEYAGELVSIPGSAPTSLTEGPVIGADALCTPGSRISRRGAACLQALPRLRALLVIPPNAKTQALYHSVLDLALSPLGSALLACARSPRSTCFSKTKHSQTLPCPCVSPWRHHDVQFLMCSVSLRPALRGYAPADQNPLGPEKALSPTRGAMLHHGI